MRLEGLSVRNHAYPYPWSFLLVLWNYLKIDISDIGQNNITTIDLRRQQFKHEVIKVSAQRIYYG